MKLLFFIDSLGPGGAQRQLVNLSLGLSARGHEVTVFTYYDFDWFKPELERGNVRYICHPKSSRFDLKPLTHLCRLSKTFNPAVVVSFMRTPSFYAELQRVVGPRFPLIVSERDGVQATGLQARDVLAGAGHLLASHLVANSHDYLNRLNAIMPLRRRSSVIYNGITADFFAAGVQRLRQFKPAKESAPRPERGTGRFCVVASRIEPKKGPMQIANALATVVKAIPECTVDWIGGVDTSNPLYGEVVACLASTGVSTHWRWLGPKKDMSAQYAGYDALVLPSLYEGVANTMIEAMASAVPVIATDIADNRRIVRDAIDGFICRANDPDSLADAMLRFCKLGNDAQKRMAESAHQRAIELFSIDKMVDQWESLCERHAA